MRTLRTTGKSSGGSIRRKLIALVLSSLVTTCLVTATLAGWIDARRQSALETERLTQTARVIGSLAARSVQDSDTGGAFVAIRSISQMPDVNYARITGPGGGLLAETGGGVRLTSDARIDDRGEAGLWSVLNSGTLQVTTPIVSEGREVGEITLLSETPGLKARILGAVLVTLAGAGVALLAGLLIALRMARRISDPIVDLARFTKDVRESGDYSRGPDIAADGEVADLVAGFRSMMDGIRDRDDRIAAHVAGLEEQVAARTAELSVARDVAEAATAAKSDFLAVMSHEIRTPMNGILALSELLSRSELPARQRRYADVIAKSGRSLLSIINDILDFSKVEAGKLDLEAVETDLAEAAEDVASLFAERAMEKGLDLAVYVDPRIPAVLADPTRLRQVLSNLANNAIKFTETGGVLLTIEPDGAGFLFSVIDTGPGIPEDKLPKLFEAFSQADQSTTRKHGGTGLGLTICDRLVRAMEGEWRLSSRLGEGSTFAFHAPLQAAGPAIEPDVDGERVQVAIDGVGPMTERALVRYLDALGIARAADLDAAAAVFRGPDAPATERPSVVIASARDEIPAGQTVMHRPVRRSDVMALARQIRAGGALSLDEVGPDTAATVQFPGARVLVVDDSDVNREVASEALQLLGVTAAVAGDGLQAVEQLRVERFDLVLMDGSMPVLDGFEASRRIRAEEAEQGRARTPILALTAHVVGSAADAWRTAGMDGVIHKPFSVGDLVKALQLHCGHLAREEAPAAPAPAAPPAMEDGLFDPAIRAELAAMAGNGRSDFVERVEGLYATNAPLRFQDIRDAVAAGDADAAARGAHALKSMSLSLGATAVAAAASTAENAARSGQTETIDIPGLALLIDRTLACFGHAAGPAGATEPDADDVRGRFERAVKDGHLHLVYQPMMARSGDFSGKVEALVRWNCPERGARCPDEFVPELEAAGLVADLTDFVMTRAMQDGAGRHDIRISFNASADEFQKVEFADRVAAAARREDFPHNRLEVEVTETAILDIEGARPTLDRLQAMGVAVALDDFGAGYTSLHALRELRFSTLKIDRSFVTRCTEDTASAAIIHAVIGVGRSLGMSIVCEGVETEAQAQFLKTAGVHLIQGYVYRRPCAFADLPGNDAQAAA